MISLTVREKSLLLLRNIVQRFPCKGAGPSMHEKAGI